MEKATYERFTTHDGLSLAYRTAGQGRRVMLLHGATVSSRVNFGLHFDDDGAGGLIKTPGPTVESALVDAGCEVALMDLRGHGRSEAPHDSARYTMDRFVDDARAFVEHLEWSNAAFVGYSFGAWVGRRLLEDPWLTRAALCGVGSWTIDRVNPNFYADWAIASRCFLEGCWDEHPGYADVRGWAEMSHTDFVAMGLVLANFETLPAESLRAVSVPVLVLNGGGDNGASDEKDLTPFIPTPRRAVAGTGHHGNAPSDPLFQAELVTFLADIDRARF